MNNVNIGKSLTIPIFNDIVLNYIFNILKATSNTRSIVQWHMNLIQYSSYKWKHGYLKFDNFIPIADYMEASEPK